MNQTNRYRSNSSKRSGKGSTMPVKAPVKTCQHEHDHAELASAQPNVDPTHTKTLRRDYMAEAYKRFRTLKGLIRKAVVDLDVLGLGEKPPSILQDLPDIKEFRFATDAKKVEAFDNWFDGAIDSHLLERPDVGEGWQSEYVRRGYDSGLRQSARELKRAGIDVPEEEGLAEVFNVPMHRDKLETLYTRNYTALKGITSAMGAQVSQVLTDGLVRGHNPRKMARKLNDRVDKIGITRARTMARTETIYTHNEAALTRYERQGLDKVTAEVEWLTAGDTRVCPLCAGMEGDIFTLKEARGMIPLHPNCRCTWLPVTGDTPRNQYDTSKEWAEDLPDAEREAVRQWTSSDYSDIRRAQRNDYWGTKPLSEAPENVQKKVRTLKRAVRNAPNYKGKAYRGMYDLDDQAFERFTQKGTEVQFEAFTSTTQDLSVAKQFIEGARTKKNVLMEIQSKTGKQIHAASQFSVEEEVLFGAGSKFEISDVEDPDWLDGLKVILREVT